MVWAAFVIIHTALVVADWHLRDPANPKVGGVSSVLGDLVCTGIFWGSIALLSVGVFLSMPRHWAVWMKALLTTVQAIVAYALVIAAHLYYMLRNGIDTL